MSGSLPVLAGAYRFANTAARYAVLVSGALTIASVLLISYDVIVRKLFGITIGGSDELSSYAFAISTSWSLAYGVMQRANVRVDVLYQYLPVRVSALLDWLSLVCMGVFIGYLTFTPMMWSPSHGFTVRAPIRRLERRLPCRRACGSAALSSCASFLR
ncbi:TRAP transporter small permease [Pannonibacter sp. Pt2-lr]